MVAVQPGVNATTIVVDGLARWNIKVRIAITLVAWFGGLMFGFILDGQSFNHSLQLLGFTVVGALPWCSQLSRRQDERRRFVAFVVIGLSAVVIVAVSRDLPAAREAQRTFNERIRTNTFKEIEKHDAP